MLLAEVCVRFRHIQFNLVEDRWANITLQFSENQHAFVYYNSEAYSPTNAYLSFEYGQIQVRSERINKQVPFSDT